MGQGKLKLKCRSKGDTKLGSQGMWVGRVLKEGEGGGKAGVIS